MTETIPRRRPPIEVGHARDAAVLGMTVNIDTVLATAIAAVIVIALAFFLRAKVTSTGVPGGVQLFFEAITIQMRDQIETAIGMKIAPFVLPLAVTLFVFILIANWLSVLPVQYTDATAPQASCSSRRPRHQLRAGARAVRVHLLPRGRHLAPRHHRAPGEGAQGPRRVAGADQHGRGDRQADLVVAPTLRQHLRRRHPGRADRAVPAVHHVGAQRDLEERSTCSSARSRRSSSRC